MAIFLMTLVDASGQKPTIGLLPSAHQRVHPEGVIDTIHSKDSLGKTMQHEHASSIVVSGDRDNRRAFRKENRRRWFQTDSIFRRDSLKSHQAGQEPKRFVRIFLHTNPVRLFIQITALKF